MMVKGESNFEEVREFYEENFITKFVEWIHKRNIHVPYYNEKNMNAPLDEACKRFNDLIIDKIPIQENEYFIDFGSGFGLLTIDLAKRKKCNVYGIGASYYQKIESQKISEEENVANLANFLVCDARNTFFKNDIFDAGLFMESIYHMGHKEALAEARRILKPGATLIIADFMALPSLTEEIKQQLLAGFHGKSVLRADEYPTMIEQSGFELVEIADVTQHTVGMMVDKYLEAINTRQDEIIKVVGSPQNYEVLKQMWTSAGQVFKYCVGFAIVTCRKK